MNKEKKDLIKQFRYFKILEDCYVHIGTSVPVKKGDIIKVYNSQLENLVFSKGGGILWALGYRSYDDSKIHKLKEYPEDKPLDIIEYLKMQPNFQLPETIQCSALVSTDDTVYVTPELLDKFFNDNVHGVNFRDGSCMRVSEYNKRQVVNFDGEFDYQGKDLGIKKLGAAININTNDEDSRLEAQKKSVGDLPQPIKKMKPGFYSTKSSFLSLVFFMEKGEVIDFSKPEYALLSLNQSFMNVLGRSEEITNPNKKLRIYEKEQRDFLPNTTTRYYRLKDDVNITSTLQLQYYINELKDNAGLQAVKHDFNPHRVKGIIDVVEMNNGRISVIKVVYTTPAYYQIVDKELKKISKRLSKKEATLMNLQEISKSQKEIETKWAERATKKGKDYFRTKMIADLAKTYVDEQPLTDEFESKATQYRFENEKLYHNTINILPPGYHLSWNDFYMMHLIRTQKRDNRIMDKAYQEKMQEKRHNLLDVLHKISKKDEPVR